MVLRKRKRTRMDSPKRKKRTIETIRQEHEEEMKFMSLLAETDGFDIEHLMDRKPSSYVLRLRNDGNYPTEVLVYAKLGIHKYNWLKGKNLQLSHVEKYNLRCAPIRSAYYISLVAKDPDALVPFQTVVFEQGFDHKSLLVGTARPKDDPVEPESSSVHDDAASYPRDAKLPQWPSHEDAFKDKKKYYLVKKSELQEYDWIRMYTELAFLREHLRADFMIEEPELSRLAIVKVAVESPKTVERPKDRLKAKNATFYIKYKYLEKKPRVGQDHVGEPSLYGIAVVRRTMNEGCFSLMFNTCFV